jgi:RNA polymerase sigma-70 factor (ECF subfamily)
MPTQPTVPALPPPATAPRLPRIISALGDRSRRGEAALIRRAQAGAEEAIEELFRRYWPVAFRAAGYITRDAAAAEDIAQEAFLAAIRNLDRFDRSRPFGPWFKRLVANRAIDWTRARKLRGYELGEEAIDGARDDAATEHPAAEVGEEVALAIGALPLDQRTAVVLRYLLEYTPGEIAELLGVPRGTVNSRLRRGLDALKAGGVES